MVLAFMFLLLDHRRNKTINVMNVATDATSMIDMMVLLNRIGDKRNLILKRGKMGTLYRIFISARRDP